MAAAALLIGLYSMVSIQAMSSKFFVKLYPINLSQTSKLKNELTRNVNLINIHFGFLKYIDMF